MSFQGHILEATDATIVGLEQHAGESSDGRSWFPNRIDSGETAVDIVASPGPQEAHLSFFPDEKDQREARPVTYIPPEKKHRCLILCFDGTGDQFDADNSNIVQLVSALKKDDRRKQMVYYQVAPSPVQASILC
jgi:hypothetical protein